MTEREIIMYIVACMQENNIIKGEQEIRYISPNANFNGEYLVGLYNNEQYIIAV